MSGRLEATFQRLRDKKEKALIAYLMAGDPGLAETEQLVVALEQAGADIIELGVPFSDPIADGPVIQQAAERALKSGTSLAEDFGFGEVPQAAHGDSDRLDAVLQLHPRHGL